ncbi:spondin domain-containing protein [Thalassomonas haliotis]|uniref:Spondin domain-containing protein n=1 Tax=Thalassomonas haliotis TaxID=485448 RepID=A0ABY7VCC6_9GAMM|nr:spondin domain-containing protein [Thalassomonas haliotis]WDE11284.1 spondin domain-containing protein [Thalassomonas haliotis]
MSIYNIKGLAPLALVTLLSACGGSDNDNDNDGVVDMPEPTPVEMSYEVTVTNLTYAQPLSPIAVVLHGDSALWTVGEMASTPLEILAEGGDNSDLIAMESVLASVSGEAAVGPGASTTLMVSTTDEMATHLSIVSMLVNTNDAFTGLTAMDLSSLTVDNPQTWTLGVYDAGTEANSELAGTIPGPADGGTGYIAERDDVDFVAKHPGVVTMDDGLSTSVLTQAHRFDNPAIKLTITRKQ